MKIGNIEDAKLIYRRRKTGFGPMPKGWKKLGEGSFRTSYLSPDNVVYKVCFEDSQGCNYNEFATFRRIRSSKVRLPRGWRVAKTKLYEFKDEYDEEVGIIAMEYVEGTHPIVDGSEYEAFFAKMGATKVYELLDLEDLHEENFLITPQGKKVIIDLGE